MSRGLGLAGAIAAVALAAHLLWHRLPVQPAAPSVVLVTIDTLRADHLGSYGYPRPTSPGFDRLAAHGVLFENAFCTMPITLPSHASILFGTWPRVHGSTSNHRKVIGRSLPYLPVLMKQAGFATAAFLSSFHLGEELSEFGGFDRFDWPRHDRSAEATLEAASGWLEETAAARSFLWVHLWDPHSPYDLKPGFMERINPSFRDGFEKRYTFFEGFRYTREQLDRMVDLYDNEIAYTDHWLTRFVDELRATRPETIFVITSDHGETLDELAETEGYGFDHGEYLLDHQIRVPLLVLLPRAPHPGRRVASTTSLVDILPTIADLCGLPVPATSPGSSLKPHLLGKPNARPDTLAFVHRRKFKNSPRPSLRPAQYGVCEREYKLLLDVPGREPLLYRAGDRPAGADPVSARLRERLEARLRQWLHVTQAYAGGEGPPVSPQMAEQLRALGYVE